MPALIERMVRAAKLDARLFEEVEQDPRATGQAIAVVLLSSTAGGVGLGGGLGTILVGALVSLAGWWVWAFLTFWIGTRLLPEPQTSADQGQLLRAIGFANAPGVLRILGLVPGLRRLVFFVAGIWALIAVVIAVRQALDYRSSWRAVVVCLVGWIVQWVIIGVVVALLAVPHAV